MSLKGIHVEKAAPSATDRAVPSGFDKDPVGFLVGPTSVDTFFSTHFEKSPLHVPANADRKKFFSGLFTYEDLVKLAAPQGPDNEPILEFGIDLNAARYVDGVRETPNGEVVDEETLRGLYEKEGCTFQVHQPQRFVDALWRLQAAMEANLGCLVGCNAYLTPAGSQGLAPHHDDVELFICQTQGTKKWRLYAPLNGFQLPSKCSGDLSETLIGEPVMEVTMNVGDVLYLPRGTIHQAVAQEGGSAHLTISTYQHWNYGMLLSALLGHAAQGQEEPACLPLELRRGLPPGHIFRAGLLADVQRGADAAGKASPAVQAVAASLAQGLRALADQLEKRPQELVSMATDTMAEDFLKHRLPPHPAQLPDPGPEPTLESTLTVRGHNLYALVPTREADDEDDEDDNEDDDMDEDGKDDDDDDEEEEGAATGKGEKAAGKKGKASKAAEEDDEDEDEDDDEGDDDEEDLGDEPDEGTYVQLVTCLDNQRLTHMMPKQQRPPALGGLGDDDYDDDDEEDGAEVIEVVGEDGDGAATSVPELVPLGMEDEEGKEGKEGQGSTKKGKGKDKAGKKGAKPGKKDEEEQEDIDMPDSEDIENALMSADDDDDERSDFDSDDDDEGLPGPIFPDSYSIALGQVLGAQSAPGVKVSELLIPGADPEGQLHLAKVLWQSGFVVCHPPGKKGGGKKEVSKKESDKKRSADEGSGAAKKKAKK